VQEALVICGFITDGHSDWCEVVSHGSFDLYFSYNQQCWAFFHVFVSHLYIFFGEMSIQVFCPFFHWLIALFAVDLYMLLIYSREKPLSVASFETIFSHSLSCLFVFFWIFFAGQKLFSLMRSHVFIFALKSIALGDWPEKIFMMLMSESVLPMFSSRSLMVSCRIIKSFSHLEVIFVPGVRVCSRFLALHAAVQVSQQCLLNRLKYTTGHHQTPRRKHRQNTLWHQHHEYFLRSVSQSNRN